MPRTTDRSEAQTQALKAFERLLDMGNSDSDAARLTAMLKAIGKDWPVAHEFPKRDFLADLDERKQLLNDWTASCRKIFQSDYEPTAIDISLFCVAPVSSLKDMSHQVITYKDEGTYDTITKNPYEAILWFLGRHPKRTAADPAIAPTTTTSPSPNPPPAKRQRVSIDPVIPALARDKGKCVLTGLTLPEATHIFPTFAASDAALKSITKLTNLWPRTDAKRWTSILAEETITESPRNILCLNRILSPLWNDACFGLKPLTTSDEAVATQSVRVQFYWLPRGPYKPRDILEHGMESIKCDGSDSNYVAHRASGIPIESGDVFTITANDPGELPSVDLLEIRWILIQNASMAGFANLTEKDVQEYQEEIEYEYEDWAEYQQSDNGQPWDEQNGEWDDNESPYTLDESNDDDTRPGTHY